MVHPTRFSISIVRPMVFLALLVAALALTGCLGGGEPPQAPSPPTDTQGAMVEPDLAYTQAAETIVAGLTQAAPSVEEAQPATEEVQPTEISQPTNTPLPTATPLPTNTPGPSSTPRPTDTPVPSVVPTLAYETAYSADFDQKIGWFTGSYPDYSFNYYDGGYRIESELAEPVWSVKSDDYGNVSIEVDTIRIVGSEGSYYGVICRHVDGGDFYALVVNTNGFYGIARMETGMLTFLEEGTAKESLSNEENTTHLRADCIGNNLSLYANDTLLATVEDGGLSFGAVGMTVGNLNPRENVDVLFDNFVVKAP